MSFNLREELQHPTTLWGKRYLSLVLFTIVVSVLFLFFKQSYYFFQAKVAKERLFFSIGFTLLPGLIWMSLNFLLLLHVYNSYATCTIY